MAAAAAAAGPMRILCLHGYAQSSHTLHKATRAFRKQAKKLPSGRSVHFEFLTAPHMAVNNKEVEDRVYDYNADYDMILNAVDNEEPDDDNEFDDGEDQSENGSSLRSLGGGMSPDPDDMFTWWYSKPPNGFTANRSSDWEHGLNESMELVVRELRYRPYAGLMGFGQGAAMAFMVLRHMEMEQDPQRPRFGLMFSHYKSPCTPHENYYAGQLNTPCLMVRGRNDPIERQCTSRIPFDSNQLFAKWNILFHSERHKIPTKSKMKAGYMWFLTKFDTVPDDS